ncbi:DUF2190 family protein [Hyphomicrobium sp. 1Nfss2.1]|uniref:hypothetical protein n=1 Tax=Hyphomicrobium sp. 1Nfss2.1 TaxID=3413936 RepID=UPI003C7A4067
MAAPNIVNVASIVGKTSRVSLSSTSATSVLNNPAGSGKVLKVNSLIVANIDGSNTAGITVGIYPQDDLGGTPVLLCKSIQVPAQASLVVVSKNAPFYLEEDMSVAATASAADDLSVVASYEEIS